MDADTTKTIDAASELEQLTRDALRSTSEAIVEHKTGTEKNPAKPVSTVHSFDVNVTTGDGKIYVGTFTSRILTIGDQIAVGKLRVAMSNGLSWSQVDPLTNSLLEKVSHLSISLTERPDWSKDLMGIYDIRVLDAIYKEVSAHEGRFLGLSQD